MPSTLADLKIEVLGLLRNWGKPLSVMELADITKAWPNSVVVVLNELIANKLAEVIYNDNEVSFTAPTVDLITGFFDENEKILKHMSSIQDIARVAPCFMNLEDKQITFTLCWLIKNFEEELEMKPDYIYSVSAESFFDELKALVEERILKTFNNGLSA